MKNEKISVLSKVSYPTEWLPHATRTIASVLAAERSHKNALSVAGTSHSLSHT